MKKTFALMLAAMMLLGVFSAKADEDDDISLMITEGKIAAAEWGEGVVEQLAQHIATTQPGLKGFTRRNLFRMRQFYEAYREPELVTALLTLLPWTHNLIILSRSKRPEER